MNGYFGVVNVGGASLKPNRFLMLNVGVQCQWLF